MGDGVSSRSSGAAAGSREVEGGAIDGWAGSEAAFGGAAPVNRRGGRLGITFE